MLEIPQVFFALTMASTLVYFGILWEGISYIFELHLNKPQPAILETVEALKKLSEGVSEGVSEGDVSLIKIVDKKTEAVFPKEKIS